MDFATNQSDHSLDIKVDTTPPTIDGTLSGALGRADGTSPRSKPPERKRLHLRHRLHRIPLDDRDWATYTAP